MPIRTQQTGEVVIARSRRTGDRYPARTSYLAGHHGIKEPYLHYTDGTRLEACRCLVTHEHKKPCPVSDCDRDLSTAMTRYMDKFGLEKCHQPDFHRYQEQQKIHWALNSVHAERFHYVSRDKTVVCRCRGVNHHFYRRVNHPAIQDLCAEFFLAETMQNLCTRDQWRAMDEKTSTGFRRSMRPDAGSESSFYSVGRSSKSSFEYDASSVAELLQAREARSLDSRKHRRRPASSPHHRPLSLDRRDTASLSGGPNGDLDIPEDVWRASRPSVYLGQENFDSHSSTPIGSSATPAQLRRHTVPKGRVFRSASLELGETAPGVDQYADVWSEDARDPAVLDLSDTSKLVSPPAPYLPRGISDLRTLEVNRVDRDESSRELRRSPVSGSMRAPATPADIVELPSPKRFVELEATLMQTPTLRYHSATLRELEWNRYGHIAELAGRSSTKA